MTRLEMVLRILLRSIRKISGYNKPIYQTENQYSKGVKVGFVYNYSRAKGEYIAFCEGDDYWTDPYKLQKQIDF